MFFVMSDKLLKLIEFSRLTNLSRKSLLVYEKKGLIVPEKIDNKNGYRYFSLSQLRKAAIISFLRNFDIPLNKLKSIIEGSTALGEYFSMSKTIEDLTRKQIKIQHALQTVKLIEKENGQFTFDAEITVLPKRFVLFSEGRGTTKDVALYFALLFRYMSQNRISLAGNAFTYYYKDTTVKQFHFKVCCPILQLISVLHADISCETFSSFKTATIRHFGDYSLLPYTYKLLMSQAEKNKWKLTGEYLETYVVAGDLKHTDSSTFITDVSGVIA
jgi:DNA-binding transcriptional MerR regulator